MRTYLSTETKLKSKIYNRNIFEIVLILIFKKANILNVNNQQQILFEMQSGDLQEANAKLSLTC